MMVKKILITVFSVVLLGMCVFAAGLTLSDSVGVIQPIRSETPCPVVGCASGQCHGFDNVPDPDGIHEMYCPEAACASTECHAWDTLTNRYKTANDASLNIWVLFPVMLITGLGFLINKGVRQ